MYVQWTERLGSDHYCQCSPARHHGRQSCRHAKVGLLTLFAQGRSFGSPWDAQYWVLGRIYSRTWACVISFQEGFQESEVHSGVGACRK